ncbi:hypothetical protein [Ignavibacterium sp.]|uniref:hypothetical protein n=1 Tax=Ignavibacterium sp. TaxID=2651167 RepID=UPI00307E40FB
MLRIIFSIVFCISTFAQTNPLKSDLNRKLFADYLYCEQDYLRAAEEYESLAKTFVSDTILYKIGKSYSIIGDYSKAINSFNLIPDSSEMFFNSKLEQAKIFYLTSEKDLLVNLLASNNFSSPELKKLLIAFYLKMNQLDSISNDLFQLSDEDVFTFKNFYERRKNPPYKSEALAGILSSIVPGAGKIYTKEYGDGITAFILTGMFSYLAYNNFKHARNFRAYLFSGLAAGFYLGNIYGSVASAQIFNAKIDFNFLKELSDYLSNKNYFINEIEFCK